MFLQFDFAIGLSPCVAFEANKAGKASIPKSLLQIPLIKIARNVQDSKAVFSKPVSATTPYSLDDCILKRSGFDELLLNKEFFLQLTSEGKKGS